jgi:hypothetical protein
VSPKPPALRGSEVPPSTRTAPASRAEDPSRTSGGHRHGHLRWSRPLLEGVCRLRGERNSPRTGQSDRQTGQHRQVSVKLNPRQPTHTKGGPTRTDVSAFRTLFRLPHGPGTGRPTVSSHAGRAGAAATTCARSTSADTHRSGSATSWPASDLNLRSGNAAAMRPEAFRQGLLLLVVARCPAHRGCQRD